MARDHAPWDTTKGTDDGPRWVHCLGKGAADHYRRVYSKDNLEGLHPEVFRLIPSSNHDPCGYMEVTQ